MILPKSQPSFASMYRKLHKQAPEGVPFLPALGTPLAKYILVASHPEPDDFATGKLFSGARTEIWLRTFEEVFQLRAEHILAFPASRYGDNPSVGSVAGTLDLCRFLSNEKPRVFIFAGALEFGLTLNGFRKKASSGLYGAAMYLPQLVGSVVSVVPSHMGLIPESENWKDIKMATYYQEELQAKLRKLHCNLKKLPLCAELSS